MYQTVNEHDFVKAFDDCGRSENFSVAGRRALFEYLTDLETDMGEDQEYELDVIALCCDFAEYGSAIEACEEYHDWERDPDEDDDEAEESARGWLEDHTTVIYGYGSDGRGCIIQVF